MAAIGEVIDGKYEILKLIGRGGMSRVYLAMDKRLNKQWAIKEIEKCAKDRNNEVVIQSAIAEANLIKQFDHPSIVRITDIIDNGKVIYIIEDYIEGETLNTVVENNGAQPQELVIEWAMQICEALEYLHTRKPPIIYRDMKPANVMLKPEGNIKIIDFGIAREYKEQGLADTVSLGTKGYAAPEQFGGRGQTDARTDIYCLGVTLYHMVTGQNPGEPPYQLYPIRHWNPQLSSGFEAIIQKCTQLNPDDRYSSCDELLYALHHYKKYEEDYRMRQKNKLKQFIGVVSACAVCLLVGVLGLFMRAKTNNADYEKRITDAETAQLNSEERVNCYSEAIKIKPLEQEAYLGMIKAIEADASFTTDEEKVLMTSLSNNLNSLRAEVWYPELAYEIGMLYWYCYDYGKTNDADNQITRMKSAVQWFEDTANYGSEADSNYIKANVYCSIGKFNRDITLKVEMGEDKGTYLPYWTSIQELVAMISANSDNAEMIELETYKLAVNAIESYARKFKADGVEQSDMTAMLETVKNETYNISALAEKTEAIKDYIVSRIEPAGRAIDNAYRE